MFRSFSVTCVVLVLWTAIMVWAVVEGWTRDEFAQANNAAQFMDEIAVYIDADKRGNVALTLIENGNVFDSLSM